MTMIAIPAADVTADALGATLHEALTAEARVALGAILPGPATPEEAAEVLDAVTAGGMDEPTLAVLAKVLGQ